MAIPNSGPISFETIRDEFQGTNPITLSQYYRGGGLVPNSAQNINVPSSGPISLSDFYGASNADLVPDPVNWNILFVSYTAWNGSSSTPNWANSVPQTISGIDTPITLRFSASDITGGGLPSNAGLRLDAYKTSSGVTTSYYTIDSLPGTTTAEYPGTNAITVVNGDSLRFQLIVYGGPTQPPNGQQYYYEKSMVVSVINTSSGNTVLDTFSCWGSATVETGTGPPPGS